MADVHHTRQHAPQLALIPTFFMTTTEAYQHCKHSHWLEQILNQSDGLECFLDLVSSWVPTAKCLDNKDTCDTNDGDGMPSVAH